MPSTPFKVKAIYDYASNEPDDLKFSNGQIITVTAEEDDDWYAGEYNNDAGKHEGIFPKNFVEKYEPAIPSRPARSAKKRESDVIQPVAALAQEEPVGNSEPAGRADPVEQAEPVTRGAEPGELAVEPASPVEEKSAEETKEQATNSAYPPTQASVQRPSSSSQPRSQLGPEKPASSKPPPPKVAEKPAVGSFRDRIAAFNLPAAAPITPFKPGGQGGTGSSGFIKKPFVAPPPSKNAFVPPPRDIPQQKVYKREEDPVMAQENVEPAVVEPVEEEDQPKPTSLKERIALLQKQQLEQASRHAEKKEKPKRPPKKQMTSPEEVPASTNDVGSVGEEANETGANRSMDLPEEDPDPLRASNRQATQAAAALATPPQPSRELMSDTNDADDDRSGDTEDARETSTEEDRPKPKRAATHESVGSFRDARPPERQRTETPEDDAEKGEGEHNDEEESEEEDPEVRRRREIRDRMAKMSGGMGMMGMFGPAGGMPGMAPPRQPKPSAAVDRQASSSKGGDEDAMARAPPVPIMALPGMVTRPVPPQPQQEAGMDDNAAGEDDDASKAHPGDEDVPPLLKRSSTGRSAPPVPAVPGSPRETRAPPPPPPTERPTPAVPRPPQVRAAPPPPPREVFASQAEMSEEEEEEEKVKPIVRRATNERPASKDGAAPALPPPPPSRFGDMPLMEEPAITMEKRLSRAPPPLPPTSPVVSSPQTRAPPPPPPGQPPSRRSTMDSRDFSSPSKHQVENDSEDEVTEYDGDYDTDIASSAKHKEALKSHNRDSSLEDGVLTDEGTPISPSSRAVPPIPSSPPSRDMPVPPIPPIPPRDMAVRDVPLPRDFPPPPPASAPKSRRSADYPRAAPPPIPAGQQEEIDYDPYRYNPPTSPPLKTGYVPALNSPQEELEREDMYDVTPQSTRSMPPPVERPPPSIPIADPSRPSSDIKRVPLQRRSTDTSRPGTAHGFIASDVDLSTHSMWWKEDQTPPPSLQNRNDVLYEIESGSSTKRGGHTTITRDVYVVYMDYSQTIINATFDPADPSHASLEQRHDRPPPPPRQDQLETASSQFGSRIAEAASSKLNSTVGDGAAHSYILELLRPLSSNALLPVGTRSYGALVYSNLANASTQQFDQIRPGDIVTFRNAKFAGHKGGLHSKYSMDAGLPGKDHVGVVIDWDGTKKKIRAWEQGREEAGKGGKKMGKVKEESFRVGDLKSGEVRVWRVMGRDWVGWNSS